MPRPKSGRTFETPWIDELRELWDRRDPHVQQLLAPFFPERKHFDGTQFIAYIVRDLKTRPNGEVDVTLTAPFEFVDEVMKLTKALTVPLSVDIQIWKPYADAVEGENGGGRLAEPTEASNGEETS